VLSRTLAHGLRSGLTQRPRQHGRPNRRGAPEVLVRAVTVVRLARVCASRPSRYVSVINDKHLVSLMNFNEAKEN
jgi:hypothetical protein